MLRSTYGMVIAAGIVFVGNCALLYCVWLIELKLPALRCCALCDRIAYHPDLWNRGVSSLYYRDSYTPEEASCCSCYYVITISHFDAYTRAVDYGVYIRDTYGIMCDIVSHDSVRKQNMVSWYMLISQAMPCAVCDTYMRVLKQHENNIRVEKCRVNER